MKFPQLLLSDNLLRRWFWRRLKSTTFKDSKNKCGNERNRITKNPRTLTAEFLKTLSASINFEYTITRYANGCEDVCSEIAQPHFHLLFYIRSFVGAEKYFKNTPALTLGIKRGLKSCYATRHISWKLFEGGKWRNHQTLFDIWWEAEKYFDTWGILDLGGRFRVFWDYQRKCYSPFSGIEDAEKVAHLCKTLQELQNSDAVFKDSVVDYIDILMRGFATMEASHRKDMLKVNLVSFNAQCQCLECFEARNCRIPLLDGGDLNYHSNLFVFHESTQFP